jgi:hypothetical protein
VHLVDPLAGRSARAARSRAGSATRSRSDPSGWRRQPSLRSPDHRPPSVLPGRGTGGRRRSRPRSRQAVRRLTDAAIQPAGGDHSCRCVHRRARRHSCRSGPACHPARGRAATRHWRRSWSREIGASAGGQNRASAPRCPLHPSGPPLLPRSIPHKILNSNPKRRECAQNRGFIRGMRVSTVRNPPQALNAHPPFPQPQKRFVSKNNPFLEASACTATSSKTRAVLELQGTTSFKRLVITLGIH